MKTPNTARLVVLVVALMGSSCAWNLKEPPNATVGYVDLPRYMGKWYMVASMDNQVERHFVNPTQTYALRGDNQTVDFTFACSQDTAGAPPQDHHLTAIVLDRGASTQWNLNHWTFYHPDYEIIGLDPDYRWAAVGTPSHKYGWILSRRPHLSEADYQSALEVFHRQNYEAERMIRMPQG
jgi:apolipoprotein D and lipocalin family protein